MLQKRLLCSNTMLKVPAIARRLKSLQINVSGLSRRCRACRKFFSSSSAARESILPKSLPSQKGIRLRKSVVTHIRNERLDDARSVFDKMSSPDVYLYTMMMAGYSRIGRMDDALQIFYTMPDRDIVSWNAMIKGCLDCGNLDLARKLFDEMPERNCISWTTIIYGLVRSGRVAEAEELFGKMPLRDTVAWNSMIHGYCNNGRIDDAHKLFEEMPSPNVVSWTTMISGLNQSGDGNEALDFFRRMWISGVEPTSDTFACVLKACAEIPSLDQGVQLHGYLVKEGHLNNTFITTSLITFYGNCKEIQNSHKVLEENMRRDVAVWTALLSGYSANSMHDQALEVFCIMTRDGIKPNQSTFTSALNSCCELEVLDKGKAIHTKTIKVGLELDEFVGNSLIVLYSQCGNIDDGLIVFHRMSKKNLVTWNAIIVGCAQHGYGQLALEFFDDMVHAAAPPDEITFIGLLTACSHCQMLEKGWYFFELLTQNPSIDVKLEHYACMADVLARCGNLEEAEEFIKNMPMSTNYKIWLALLSACRVHCNLEVGRRAAKCIFELEPHDTAAYTLLSNIYASMGRWGDVSCIRTMMKGRGILKTPGRSWITFKGTKHEFSSGDRSHPMSKQIYEKLDSLDSILKESNGLDTWYALHDVEDPDYRGVNRVGFNPNPTEPT
ncbi:hypothetical protein ACLOJK_027746 [Asimina triloba]